jgi:hypothetical protein
MFISISNKHLEQEPILTFHYNAVLYKGHCIASERPWLQISPLAMEIRLNDGIGSNLIYQLETRKSGQVCIVADHQFTS